jgi:hypothetical protein
MARDRKIHRTLVAGRTGYAVPLVVSVTGHRDLVADEVPAIRERVREFLKRMARDYPERGVTVMSSLAEGADQLVAEEALALDIPLVVPLPMPLDIYITDFDTPAAKERFQRLLDQASEVYDLPLAPGNTRASIARHGKNRTRQYGQLGVFLCAHCHILLALWDGKYNDKVGGTGQVVRFHHDDVMPGYTPRNQASRLMLTDDESDLVYHIVCSRARPDGEPAEGLEPLSCSWYTTDDDQPRTAEMPDRHRQVFAHSRDFSRDAIEYESRIMNEAWPLYDKEKEKDLPPGIGDIDHVFRVADWLAIFYQRRILRVLRTTHMLALLMGLMYILYSDLLPNRVFLVAFVLFFLAAAAIHTLGNRLSWHRKYLDYRTLAEGLRVQFYWAAAGVTSGNVSKFAHDNFLQAQDPDLGWIRNVMRVAGTECDASLSRDPAGLEFAIREWIGDDQSGQLGYFRRKAGERIERNRVTDQAAMVVLWVSIAAIALFIFATDDLADRVRDPIVILMGILLLSIGIRQSYAFSTADSELVKQYEFMYRIFRNARRRIDATDDPEEQRRVLKVLGDAALEEHAEWILMHRERSIDQGEIWRMGGG